MYRFARILKRINLQEVGEWFREKGVNKITVSSVEMAEYFALHGWQDITIAFSINIRQLERIRKLAQKIHLGVLVENMQAVESLSQLEGIKVDAWVKVDVGNNRTGLDWLQVDEVFALCSRINQSRDAGIERAVDPFRAHLQSRIEKRGLFDLPGRHLKVDFLAGCA